MAGRRSPGFMSFGRKSWLWISSPSGAFVSTICGVTCAYCGKSFDNVGYTTLVAPPATGTMPMDAGCAALKYSTARLRPDASGVGDTSTPSSVEICFGVPPATGTDQMCRFSMSVALVL